MLPEACALSMKKLFGSRLSCGRRDSARLLGLGALITLVSGCAWQVGPDYVPPDIVVSDEWHQHLVAGMSAGEAEFQRWWTTLDDAQLNALIADADQGSLDLQIATARIREARALLGATRGNRFPDLDATGAAQRQGSRAMGSISPQTQNVTQAGVEATWEIDLWGRVGRSVESATASYEAALEDYRDVSVVLYADIGSTYVQLRTLQRRVVLARANVALQRETLELVAARHRAELAPDLELRQAELNLASTEAVIPSLQAALARSVHRLSVLLGEHPGALHARLDGEGELPNLPAVLDFGIPADLLRRRPDLRRTERQLAAQTARIGVATSALYPNFFLAGDFSYAAASGNLFNRENRAWSIGPFFSWNLFDGGRVRQSIKVEEARTEQLLLAYERTVLSALQDVEDSLVLFAEERQREAALSRAVAAATEADRLVRELYKRGLTNFQNVLDTQRALFSQQDLLAESQGNVILNLISIYRALGGGWAP